MGAVDGTDGSAFDDVTCTGAAPDAVDAFEETSDMLLVIAKPGS